MTTEQLQTQIAADITNKTAAESITAADVGNNMSDIVVHIGDEIARNVQNNLLPSATKSPSVDAVNAGLESYAEDVQAQIDAGIAGVYKDAGNYDASVGTFPTLTAQGEAIEAGDLFTVSVAGTLGGVSYVAGESFRALVNTPGQTASNWLKLVYVAGTQTTTQAGLVRKATDEEVVAGTANDNSVSTKQLQDKLDNLPSSVATLQEVIAAGNTSTSGTSKTTILSGGVKIENTSTTPSSSVTVLPTYIELNKSYSGTGKPNRLYPAQNPASGTTVYMPDESGTLATQKYKSYVALISQSGTSAPTVTVLQNDLGQNITWSRESVGNYKGTLSGNPSILSTSFLPAPNKGFITGDVRFGRIGDDLAIDTSVADIFSDDVLQSCYIEIRVYN